MQVQDSGRLRVGGAKHLALAIALEKSTEIVCHQRALYKLIRVGIDSAPALAGRDPIAPESPSDDQQSRAGCTP